jgi:ABC-2 type transport system ATP-binding protein
MIQVNNLTKSYGSLKAVDGISFEVQAGQILGFLGPNGAGKTTTIRILTGYLPADGGRATVAGCDVFAESMQLRRLTGYLPESTPLYTDMRVSEYLRFRARLLGVPRSQVKGRIDAVADQCWLKEYINRPIGQLSKGMRQRVGLADALIHDPQVVFLDEPTIGLDPSQIRNTRELIAGLAEKRTVVLSSHILSDVEAICSQVVIINRGRVVAQGSPSDLSDQVSATSRVVVELKAPASEASQVIQKLAGVSGVTHESHDGWTRLHVEWTGDDVRPAIADAASKHAWGLRELRREIGGLEEFFVRIVAEESTGGPQ